MSRPRSVNKSLAAYPHLKVRPLKTKTRYYYRHHDGRQEALGDDLPAAIEKYLLLETGGKQPDTIKYALESYRTSERYRELSTSTQYEYSRAIVRLSKVFGPGAFCDLRTKHLSDYLKASSHKTLAKNDIACLSSMWTWARSEGLTDLPNPRMGMRLRTPKKEQKGVTKDEFCSLHAAGCPEFQDLLDLLYLTGQDVMRVASWKRTDIVDGYLQTRRTKTGATIRIKVEGEFAAVIQRCLTRPRSATGPYIVQTDRGQRLTMDMIWYRVEAARKAGGARFELRALRRQTASDADTLAHAQELLGHEDSKTTLRHYRKGPKVRPLK